MVNRGGGRRRGSRGCPAAATETETATQAIDTPSVSARSTPPSTPRSASDAPAETAPGPSHRSQQRRERCPNWKREEVLILIQAKRDQHLDELERPDARHLMKSEAQKWASIVDDLHMIGYSPVVRDKAACKTKWNQLHSDYKRVADFCKRTGMNFPEYWELSALQRRAEKLPLHFEREFFEAIHEWFGARPVIRPLHRRDILSPEDANFDTAAVDAETDATPRDEDVDPFNAMPNPSEVPANSASASQRRRDCPPLPPQFVDAQRSGPSNAQKRKRGLGALPAGVVPHILSLSTTASSAQHRRAGNTAVRRKNVAGHFVIAEATKATSQVMASQMQGIADASLVVEQSKIEVQTRLFSEQMAYQRMRDSQLHESATASRENERLSIEKQGQMVSCLAQLSEVLARGLVPNAFLSQQSPGTPFQNCQPSRSCSEEHEEATVPNMDT